ncbi:MAG: hypothetical protein M3Y86_06880 [Verrucomicrobiota bacterium]|nr:hypothetical protein [Verrucomicrobiota bacterium]
MRFRLDRELRLRVTASTLGAALFLALALAASPQLHARLHHDSGAASHECAVTLITTGSYEHSVPPVVLLPPEPAAYFATVPAYKTAWVGAAFLGASIFEHAPPAIS